MVVAIAAVDSEGNLNDKQKRKVVELAVFHFIEISFIISYLVKS
jgi:hypothetical protein